MSAYAPLGRGHSSGVVFFRKSDAERFNVNQVDDPDVRSFSDNRSLGGYSDWRSLFAVGPGTLALRLGAGGSASQTRVRIYAERISPGLTTDIESPIAKVNVYSIADLVVGRLTVSGGTRYDLVRIPFRNRLDASRDTTSTFHRLSPRGGLNVSIGSRGSIYASVGESFRPPAVIELACADPEEPCPLPFALGDDPPLDPVIATTFELGGRWGFGTVELTASGFRTNVRDDVFLFPYDDASSPAGSTIDGYFANVAKTRREGVELSSRGTVGRVELYGNYAWTHATFQAGGIEIFSIREELGGKNDVEKGDRLPLVPSHAASLGASARFPRGMSLDVAARYTGARVFRGDEANEETPLDGHWLMDVSFGVEFRAWDLRSIVRNMVQTRYATFGTFNINQGAGDVLERFMTPGAPRTLQVILRRRIGR